jgi:hypothetical protein
MNPPPIADISPDQLDQVVQDYHDAGARNVTTTKQDDGNFTVQAVFDEPIAAPSAPQPSVHHVLASSFADPADVAAFRRCKAQGKTDQQCFKVGDNGIGFMGDDCTTSTPMCALPVEDWMEKWGSKEMARLKPVLVTIGGTTVTCLMGDTMPKRENITNGAGIDLSPGALAALGLEPPLMVHASWAWADESLQPA